MSTMHAFTSKVFLPIIINIKWFTKLGDDHIKCLKHVMRCEMGVTLKWLAPGW